MTKIKKKIDCLVQAQWKEVSINPDFFADKHIRSEDEEEIEENAKFDEAWSILNRILYERVVDLIQTHFTDHQKKVLALLQMPEKTYGEVSELLNINYTAVSHAIKGIKNKKEKDLYHGGFEKKLKKVCSKDEQCNKILDEMKELKNKNLEVAIKIINDNVDEYGN